MTLHSPTPVQDRDFTSAMRQLASGVSLVTCRDAFGKSHGMLVTAVSSVTSDPPMLLVCVNRSATMYAELIEAGAFCVNFLADSHRPLAQKFSSRDGRESRFDAARWLPLATGAPALGDALASVDCRVAQCIQAGTHTILLGSVEAIRHDPSAGAPLVYFDRQYGTWTGAHAHEETARATA